MEVRMILIVTNINLPIYHMIDVELYISKMFGFDPAAMLHTLVM